MAIRYDLGALEIKKPYKTHDGMVICEATFARDGILEYRTPDGDIRREFRPPEENQKALTSFGLAPVTIEHPPVLVTDDNAEDYRKGISLQNVKYGKGGFVRGEVVLMDSAAIAYATSGEKAEISAGYTCDVIEKPGMWRGQPYTHQQTNLKINHLAITQKGRAGPDVRLHMDSLSDTDVAYQVSTLDSQPNPKQRMATLRIDAAEFNDVPDGLAIAVAPKLAKLDSLETEVLSLRKRVDELEEENESLQDERDRETGRADAQDILITNAETVLDSLGYTRSPNGDYVRVDGKGKWKKEMEDDMDDDEEMDDEDAEGEYMHKNKKKGMKKDSADEVRVDAKQLARDLLTAWKEADRIAPRSDSNQPLSEQHFDAVESPLDVKKLVIAAVRPNVKLDGKSEGYIEGVYDSIKEEFAQRGDSEDRNDAGGFTDELANAIAQSRANGAGGSPLQKAYDKNTQTVTGAWQQPMALSRSH